MDNLVLPPEGEIILGRDRECHVRYSETDELVSRRHLKIVATREKPARYMAVDLGSRNGTFVNRQRVFGALALSPGAHVQLGAGGPEFEFQLDTASQRDRAPEAAKSAKPSSKRNRETPLARRIFLMSLPLAVGAAGGAAYVAWPRVIREWEHWRRPRPVLRSATFDPQAAIASLVSVEAEWRVLHKSTGARLTRAYIANERISGTEHVPLLEGAAKLLPAFVLQAAQRIEPLLVPAGSTHAGRPIGGVWSSRGVVAPLKDAVLSAAPAPVPWETPYAWPGEEPAGALLILEADRVKDIVPLAGAQFPRWVSSSSGWLADQFPSDLHGEGRGRLVSRDDLKIELAARIEGSKEELRMTGSDRSPSVLATALPSGATIHASPLPKLADPVIPPVKGQAVWVVGKGVEAAEIQEVSSDGRIRLPAARCADGGAVFDRQGQLVALCVPELHPASGGGSAILLDRALKMPAGETDGEGR